MKRSKSFIAMMARDLADFFSFEGNEKKLAERAKSCVAFRANGD